MAYPLLFLLACAVAGCSFQGSIGPPGPAIIAPPGDKVIEAPGGAVIEEPPAPPPIETVITGLNQAQTVRSLVRQLARP
jgi:hypothetical protein